MAKAVKKDMDVPQHVAIIMDGNGRWANKRGLPRVAGHRQGAEAARRIVRLASEAGIEYIPVCFCLYGKYRPGLKESTSSLLFFLNLLDLY